MGGFHLGEGTIGVAGPQYNLKMVPAQNSYLKAPELFCNRYGSTRPREAPDCRNLQLVDMLEVPRS